MKTSPIRQIMHFILALLLVSNPLLGAFYPLVPAPLTPARIEAALPRSQQPASTTVHSGDNWVLITDVAYYNHFIT